MEEKPSKRPVANRLAMKHLRAWRQWKGMSQDALKEKSGVAISTISKLETGERTANYKTAGTLARALGITMEQLLHVDPEKQPEKVRAAA